MTIPWMDDIVGRIRDFKLRESEAATGMRTWVYKCNARNSAGPESGDWRHLFDEGYEVWGADTLKGMSLVRPGDRIIATQTDKRALAGVARVVGFVRQQGVRHVKLRPVESIWVKIPRLKKASPAIASIPALQGGPIATIYPISEGDAGRLLAAAKAAKLGRTGAGTGDSKATEPPSADSITSYLQGSQGFEPDPRVRRAIEIAAVRKARRHYEGDGYGVVEVGKPFDLECTKGRSTLFVEVKGSRGPATKIFLTPNEVSFARTRKMELFIVHSMKLEKAGRAVVATGGTRQIISPWKPRASRLAPVMYSYDTSAGAKSEKRRPE